MKKYMAPMEGSTGYVYRRCFNRCFKGIDKYFSPFIAAGPEKSIPLRNRKDILPEHNVGIPLVPQILTNKAEDAVRTMKEIMDTYGYKEFNLNLGCPSGTVTGKGKASAQLHDTHLLRQYLEGVYDGMYGLADISVKTRIGFTDSENWEEILDIYNDLPITELIIHPRLRTDMYKPDTLHMDAWDMAYAKSKLPLIYNGDIRTAKGACELIHKYEGIEGIMMGRGLVRNPTLAEEISSEQVKDVTDPAYRKRLLEFFHVLADDYDREYPDCNNTLCRLKEIWSMMGDRFADDEKLVKKIKKSHTSKECMIWIEEILH